MSKKISTFANDNDEPTALATDIGKPIPILEGEVAERFIKNMEEVEKRARYRTPIPKSDKAIRQELIFKKWMYDFEKRKLEDLETEIKDLEQKLNGKTKEE